MRFSDYASDPTQHVALVLQQLQAVWCGLLLLGVLTRPGGVDVHAALDCMQDG